jgi:hypothetical protein
MMSEALKKVYIGDGLYAEYNGYCITLRTPRDDGEHFVVLEDDVMQQFLLWIDALASECPHLIEAWRLVK